MESSEQTLRHTKGEEEPEALLSFTPEKREYKKKRKAVDHGKWLERGKVIEAMYWSRRSKIKNLNARHCLELPEPVHRTPHNNPRQPTTNQPTFQPFNPLPLFSCLCLLSRFSSLGKITSYSTTTHNLTLCDAM